MVRCAIEPMYILLVVRYSIYMSSQPIIAITDLVNRLRVSTLAVFVAVVIFMPGVAFAAPAPPPKNAPGCVKISIAIDIKGTSTNCVPLGGGSEANVIFAYMFGIINLLAIGAGILSVGGIIVGGIRYSLAKGNPAQIQKAIFTIVSSVIGLFLFFILVVLFNFLIPGGIIK